MLLIASELVGYKPTPVAVNILANTVVPLYCVPVVLLKPLKVIAAPSTNPDGTDPLNDNVSAGKPLTPFLNKLAPELPVATVVFAPPSDISFLFIFSTTLPTVPAPELPPFVILSSEPVVPD